MKWSKTSGTEWTRTLNCNRGVTKCCGRLCNSDAKCGNMHNEAERRIALVMTSQRSSFLFVCTHEIPYGQTKCHQDVRSSAVIHRHSLFSLQLCYKYCESIILWAGCSCSTLNNFASLFLLQATSLSELWDADSHINNSLELFYLAWLFLFYSIDGDVLWFLKCAYCKSLWTKVSAKCIYTLSKILYLTATVYFITYQSPPSSLYLLKIISLYLFLNLIMLGHCFSSMLIPFHNFTSQNVLFLRTASILKFKL